MRKCAIVEIISALMNLGSDKETIFLFEFLINVAMKNEFLEITDAVYDGIACCFNSINIFSDKPIFKTFCFKNSEKIILEILKNFLESVPNQTSIKILIIVNNFLDTLIESGNELLNNSLIIKIQNYIFKKVSKKFKFFSCKNMNRSTLIRSKSLNLEDDENKMT